MSDPSERRRPILGLHWLVSIAILGAVAVIGFAVSPVEQDSISYSFKPGGLRAIDSVVAPLALARVMPDVLELSLPCDEPGSSFVSMDPWVWWSSPGAEHSPLQFLGLGDRLKLTVESDRVFVEIGEHEIIRIPIEDANGCVAELDYRSGVLQISAAGRHEAAEVGTFRFTEATFAGPAATSSISEVMVETRELGSSPSTVQLMLLGVAAVLLVVTGRGIIIRGAGPAKARWFRSGFMRRIRIAVGVVDLSVLGVLVVWAFLIPTNIDDGWMAAIRNSYHAYGDFSFIFDNSAASPLGYWMHWVQHQWLEVAPSALMARLPALLLGMLTWTGIRSLGRSLGVSGRGFSVWLMGAVFAVGFGAWGMTLRPEPFVAALVVASLVLAFRFRRGERGWTIVGWLLVIALGLTVHPTGILVIAPVLAVSRDLWRWVRSSREAAWIGAASVLFLGSLTVLLLLIDSNLATLFEHIRAVLAHSGGQDSTIVDELSRYDLLDETPYATVLRRLDSAFLLIGLGVFLIRKRRRGDARSLVGWSTLVAVGLLAFVPSKWPVHFGALVGLVALLVTVELRGIDPGKVDRDGGDVDLLSGFRLVIALVGTGVLITYAWSISLPWTAFDLRTLEWWRGLDLSAPWTWVVIGFGITGLLLAHRRWRRPVGWTPPGAVVLAASLAAIVFTVSTLVIDTVGTDSWTFGRQNLRSLVGQEGCGLGDEVMVPVPGSLQALDPTREAAVAAADQAATERGFEGGGEFIAGGFSPSSLNNVRPLEGMADVGSWVTRSDDAGDGNVGSFRTAWHRVEPGQDTLALMVMGLLEETSGNAIAVQWGASTETGVEDVGIESVGAAGYFTDWSLRTLAIPLESNRVRLLLRDVTTGAGNAWVASSLPLAVATASVGEVARSYGSGILITPPLALYFPCVQVPLFAGSVVSPPGLMIQMWKTVWQHSFAAAALADRYFRVPLAIDPPPRSIRIGGHLGDIDNFMFVSQEYLTGRSARGVGEFVRDD